jgi:hypothetical protein
LQNIYQVKKIEEEEEEEEERSYSLSLSLSKCDVLFRNQNFQPIRARPIFLYVREVIEFQEASKKRKTNEFAFIHFLFFFS